MKKKKNMTHLNSWQGNFSNPEGRVALWLATCARKPKVPGSSPAASYVQR